MAYKKEKQEDELKDANSSDISEKKSLEELSTQGKPYKSVESTNIGIRLQSLFSKLVLQNEQLEKGLAKPENLSNQKTTTTTAATTAPLGNINTALQREGKVEFEQFKESQNNSVPEIAGGIESIREKYQELYQDLQVQEQKEALGAKNGKALEPKALLNFQDNTKHAENKVAEKNTATADNVAPENYEPAKALVTVGTNADGEITDLSKFYTAQPSSLAIKNGYSKDKKLSNIVAKVKKRGHSLGESKGRLNLSMGG